MVLLEGSYGVLDSHLRRKQSKSLEGLNFEYGVGYLGENMDGTKRKSRYRLELISRSGDDVMYHGLPRMLSTISEV